MVHLAEKTITELTRGEDYYQHNFNEDSHTRYISWLFIQHKHRSASDRNMPGA